MSHHHTYYVTSSYHVAHTLDHLFANCLAVFRCDCSWREWVVYWYIVGCILVQSGLYIGTEWVVYWYRVGCILVHHQDPSNLVHSLQRSLCDNKYFFFFFPPVTCNAKGDEETCIIRIRIRICIDDTYNTAYQTQGGSSPAFRTHMYTYTHTYTSTCMDIRIILPNAMRQ